jgi:hypothetical protein
MRFLYIIIFLICLLPSCTQPKANKDKPPTQDNPEITILPVAEPVRNRKIMIGGYEYTTPTFGHMSVFVGTGVPADLTGIEQVVNTENLFLTLQEWGNIDFSPLSSLTNLQVIRIWGGALTEIPDFSGIPSLVSLEITFAKLNDLDGLEKIPQLERLDISETRTPRTDTSALQYLKKLRELQLYRGNFNINFSHLKDLPYLEEINLVDCGDFDLADIGQLTQVKKLK